MNDAGGPREGLHAAYPPDRLRHLETDGLSDRQVLETRPLGVAYPVTAKGETALRFLDDLRRWSEEELGLTDDGPARGETT